MTAEPAAGATEGGGALGPPLAGLRVLDLTRVLSGPIATLLLADLGAEIWKVEHPAGGDETRHIEPTRQGESHYFMAVNRSKRSLAIDLKDRRGRDLALGLARQADVLVENFRPGVAARLGLGFEEVHRVNPRLVYCSVSAFGQTGPEARRTAFDVALQAMGGLMHITGEPGGPPVRAGLPVADLMAGLVADSGILAALVERHHTGVGRYVDVGMLDTMVGMLSYYAGRFFMTGEEPGRAGSGHLSVVPYGAFPAADGEIVLATLSEGYWPRLCQVLGRADLAADPRFATNAARVGHRREIEDALADTLRRRPVAHWQRLFAEADIPHAPILSIGGVVRHPQVLARAMVRQADHPLLGTVHEVGPIIKFDRADPPAPVAAPLLGQHTRSVLHDVLGLEPDELDRLQADGVVATSAGDATPPGRSSA